MKVRWQVEIEDFPTRVLEKHWPDVARFRDVRDCGAHNLERVDLIAGGFPCQPVSQSGKRRAQADERWLWPEFARILRELRPRYAFLENVSGLLARGFGDVLGDLAELGYDVEWECLPASAFGAPQPRWRVWVVAHAHREGCGRGKECDCGTPAPIIGAPRDHAERLALARRRAHEAPALVRRMDHGVPRRVDRNRALGNAVVPQVAEAIGRAIMRAEVVESASEEKSQ